MRRLPLRWEVRSLPNRDAETAQLTAITNQDQSWRVFPETLDDPAADVARDITASYNQGRSSEASEAR